MKVILLEKVEKLGNVGEIVTVKPGYARNFLLPTKKVLRANANSIALFEQQKKDLEAAEQNRKEAAEAKLKTIEGLEILLIRQAGDSGQLYGSVTSKDVAAYLTEKGYDIKGNQVKISKPIKAVGISTVKIDLHPDVSLKLDVNVARSEDEAKKQKEDLLNEKSKGKKKKQNSEEKQEIAAEEAIEQAKNESEEQVSTETNEEKAS